MHCMQRLPTQQQIQNRTSVRPATLRAVGTAQWYRMSSHIVQQCSLAGTERQRYPSCVHCTQNVTCNQLAINPLLHTCCRCSCAATTSCNHVTHSLDQRSHRPMRQRLHSIQQPRLQTVCGRAVTRADWKRQEVAGLTHSRASSFDNLLS